MNVDVAVGLDMLLLVAAAVVCTLDAVQVAVPRIKLLPIAVGLIAVALI